MVLPSLDCSFCELSFPFISSTSLPDIVSNFLSVHKGAQPQDSELPMHFRIHFKCVHLPVTVFCFLVSALFKDLLCCFFFLPPLHTHSLFPHTLPSYIRFFSFPDIASVITWQKSSVCTSPHLQQPFTGIFTEIFHNVSLWTTQV